MTKLRIISGDLRGRCVSVGEGAAYRPTQERVRESVAEIVKRKIWGAATADLCAGSGAFGFEMVSRGAASADFVEADGRAADIIAASAAELGVGKKVRVIRDDIRRFADNAEKGRYDIIFYDPPYDNEELRGLTPRLLCLLKEGGLLIYERRRARHEKRSADTGGKTNIIDARIYSDTVIEIYKREENADSADTGNV
ncbi:MAG: RsmD family RNA methyltransferase [Chitinispirillia bacterium]|nr:RsmD family RNA methyltransferase [Chitinispirillia bacterium]MCL2268254.1 RsmD family RNA methyltransferase [Chitinispirillia bacterium]